MRYFNYRAVYNFADELHKFHNSFACHNVGYEKNAFWFKAQIARFMDCKYDNFDANAKKAIVHFVTTELCGPKRIVGKHNFRRKIRRFIESNFQAKTVF